MVMVMAISMSLLGSQQLDEAAYWYTPYFYETNVKYRYAFDGQSFRSLRKFASADFGVEAWFLSEIAQLLPLLELIIKYNAGYVTKRRRPDFVLPDLVPVSHANPCQEQLWVDVSRDKKERIWSYHWWRDLGKKLNCWIIEKNVRFNFGSNLVSKLSSKSVFCIKFFSIQKNIQSWIKDFQSFHKRK